MLGVIENMLMFCNEKLFYLRELYCHQPVKFEMDINIILKDVIRICM